MLNDIINEQGHGFDVRNKFSRKMNIIRMFS